MLRARSGRVALQRSKLFQKAWAALSTASNIEKYDHSAVEKKWQKYWLDNNVFTTRRRPGAKKKYILDMFPYPSGTIFE